MTFEPKPWIHCGCWWQASVGQYCRSLTGCHHPSVFNSAGLVNTTHSGKGNRYKPVCMIFSVSLLICTNAEKTYNFPPNVNFANNFPQKVRQIATKKAQIFNYLFMTHICGIMNTYLYTLIVRHILILKAN